MGRDNIIPKRIFGKMNKNGVPIYNLMIVAVIGLVGILFSDSLLSAVSLISFGAVTGFILVNISVPAYFLKKEGRRGAAVIFRYGIMPIIGALICAVLWVNITMTAKIVGLVWLAIGVIVLAVKTKGFRQLPPEMDIE